MGCIANESAWQYKLDMIIQLYSKFGFPLLIICGTILLSRKQRKIDTFIYFMPFTLFGIPILIMFLFSLLIWNESEKIIMGDYALSNIFCYMFFGLISTVYLLRSKHGLIHPK